MQVRGQLCANVPTVGQKKKKKEKKPHSSCVAVSRHVFMPESN